MIQLFIIDWFPYCHSALDTFSNSSIRTTIKRALAHAQIKYPVYPLLAINKFKQFVILLFTVNSSKPICNQSQYKAFYEYLQKNLSIQIAYYIGKSTLFTNIREETGRIHAFMNDNVTEKPGIYYTNSDSDIFSSPLDIGESVARWEKLLNSGHKNLLRSEIIGYIDKMIASNHANFQNLCSLHQQLTQIFF